MCDIKKLLRNAESKKRTTNATPTPPKKIEQPFEPIDLDMDDDELDALVSQSKRTSDNTITVDDKIEEQPPAKKIKLSKPIVASKKTMATEKKEKGSSQSVEEILESIPSVDLENVTTKEGAQFAWKGADGDNSGASGEPDIPEGRENCLMGLTIVFTGTLPNLDRPTSENLAKKYGARVTKSISKKTSVVVLGEEAGPKKLENIKKLGIKAINEEGFKRLIAGMPVGGGDSEEADKARRKLHEQEEQAMKEAEQMAKDQEEREKNNKATEQSGANLSSRSTVIDENKLWTTKYAPTDLKQLCGNKGAIQKLNSWLQTWDTKKKPDMRAVMLSGPPGIGKTTAAHLVAKSLGYDVLEKNASDVRSKGLLNASVKFALDHKSVIGMFKSISGEDSSKNGKRFVIIMDEVDGMSGGDRGGVGQLAQFCRKTNTPMILICNERNLPKMRPFDRSVLDIPFRRPDAQAVKARLMTISMREKFKLDPNVIDRLVSVTRGDIRQIINLLSTVTTTSKSIGSDNIKSLSDNWEKNVALKIFDITPKLLSGGIYTDNGARQFPLYKKMELYFDDFDFTPLMIQENYTSTSPSLLKSGQTHLDAVAAAAESISEGDLVDRKIRSAEQQWSLLPLHAILSTVRPASMVAGNVSKRINFSAFLGQNSKMGKFYRLLQDIQYHTRLSTSTNKLGLRLQYMPTMKRHLLDPLLREGSAAIEDVISFMDNYYLSKDHWDSVMQFYVGNEDTTSALKSIPSSTKSAFTRAYNNVSHPTPIMKLGTSTGKPSAAARPDFEDVVDNDDEVPVEDEVPKDSDEIDFKKDKFIKQVGKKKAKAKAKRATTKK
ncbi:unnamed protein product [Kluyveromyces dobzhanskii CBS 2104]|uniref:Replication factor C subunit 1 n=1 Tax=Kluyveromyces dobzhanskii CBS 2104 TaxID=1427455 RepID=A0A0A8L3F2_9SACH|nr:unnamed protein product [Kluyveromyces dobzhanskii CBS 2104]